ncbi:hypothetical protein GS489_33405 [Rhodococcus hoagii]|nr:hypothetical protein [Prescottella equi]
MMVSTSWSLSRAEQRAIEGAGDGDDPVDPMRRLAGRGATIAIAPGFGTI